jgi:hypothetical protein
MTTILYKYFPPHRQTFFYKPMLRFTPPSALNDPFEGKASYKGLTSHAYLETEFNANADKIFEEQIQALHPALRSLVDVNMDIVKSFVRSQMPAISEMMNSKVARDKLDESTSEVFRGTGLGILSLSALKDSLLMWAHYCQDHKGFVVGFDTSHSFFDRRLRDDDVFRCIKPVVYAKERPSRHVTDYSSGEAFFEDLLCTKSKDWEYESEWRMIIAGIFCMTQYGTHGLDAIPVEAIREVYLGVKSGQELKDCAAAFCRENAIAIYQMELHETDYALQPAQITLS